MKTKTRKIAKILIAAAVTIILVAVLLKQVKVEDIGKAIANVPVSVILLAFALYLISHFFRACRFSYLLKEKIGKWLMFKIVLFLSFVNSIIPARIGELSYIYLAKKRGVRVTEGISTLIIARISDIFAVIIMFVLGILLSLGAIKHPAAHKVLLTMGILSALLFLAVLLSIFYSRKFLSLLGQMGNFFRIKRFKIFNLLFGKFEEFHRDFSIIKDKKIILITMVFAFCIWLPQYVMVYLFLNALHIPFNIMYILALPAFSIFVSILPIHGFGGFGVVETGWLIGLVLFNVPRESAIIFGFTYHIITFCYLILMGVFGTITLFWMDKDKVCDLSTK